MHEHAVSQHSSLGMMWHLINYTKESISQGYNNESLSTNTSDNEESHNSETDAKDTLNDFSMSKIHNNSTIMKLQCYILNPKSV